MTHREFRLSLIRDLTEGGGRVLGSQITPQGMPTLSISRFKVRHNMHWPDRGLHAGVVCSVSKKHSRTINICLKFNDALCAVPCFRIYHTKSKV
jgi:hypothetical protein